MKKFKEVKYVDLAKDLKRAGFKRVGGTKHETWKHTLSNLLVFLPRHTTISAGVCKRIYKCIDKAN